MEHLKVKTTERRLSSSLSTLLYYSHFRFSDRVVCDNDVIFIYLCMSVRSRQGVGFDEGKLPVSYRVDYRPTVLLMIEYEDDD